jgi:hypothetical protein
MDLPLPCRCSSPTPTPTPRPRPSLASRPIPRRNDDIGNDNNRNDDRGQVADEQGAAGH